MKDLSLRFLGVASPVLLVALLLPWPFATWIFALVSVLVPVALIGLGAAVHGRVGPLARSLVVLALLLEAGALGLFLLAGRSPVGPGLPPATSWALWSLALLPLVVVASSFAADFARFTARAASPRRDPGTEEAD